MLNMEQLRCTCITELRGMNREIGARNYSDYLVMRTYLQNQNAYTGQD
jgi:hypothetical protein